MIPWALGVALLAACGGQGGGQSGAKVGWQETTAPGHLAATYTLFDGSVNREVASTAGQVITLTWAATAESGTVYVGVQQPDGTGVWGALVQNSQGGAVDISAVHSGNYTVIVRGVHTRGSFDLRWTVS
jgi:hypothetical protein